jgi:hypothetical protein
MTTRVGLAKASPQRLFAFELRRCGYAARARISAVREEATNLSRSRVPPGDRILSTIEAEHKLANGRRQVAVLPIGTDCGDEIGRRHVARDGDLSQSLPERVFQADACLATGTDPAQENWRVSFRGAGKPPCLVSLPRDHPARPVSRPILRQWSSG